MDDREFLAFLEGHRIAAVGFRDDEIAKIQKNNLDRYHGIKYGDEEEGRSQVVSHDVAEGIDETMPDILDLFLSNDKTVEFVPENEDDVEIASLATDVVSHIFWQENDGLTILHDFFKDGLIQINGFIKVWWEESEERVRETYENLSILQLALFEDDDDVEILEHDEEDFEPETEDIAAEYSDGKTHTITIQRSAARGRVRVAAIPPEEILIAPLSRSIAETPYLNHRAEKSISDIISEGLASEEDALKLSGDDGDAQDRKEHRHKNESDDEVPESDLTREVWVNEEYVRADFDGDGFAELRKVIRVGDDILFNEEISEIPIETFTPKPMPHKIYGVAMADDLTDVARIKTVVTRGLLDSLYLHLNPRKYINERAIGENTIDDLTTDRIGAIVRINGRPAEEMVDQSIPFVGKAGFETLEYFDRVGERRTGISNLSRGLPDEALSDNATTTVKLMAQSERRKKLIGRFAAEAFGRVCKLILKTAVRHQDFTKIIRLRDEWVTIDPRTWNISMDVQINVGLGNASFEEKFQNQSFVMGLVREAFENGVTGYDKLHNAVSDVLEVMGLHDMSRYFTSPEKFEPPEQPPTDNEVKIQIETMKAEKAQETAKAKIQSNEKLRLKEMELEFKIEMQKAEIEGFKIGVGLESKQLDSDIDGPR